MRKPQDSRRLKRSPCRPAMGKLEMRTINLPTKYARSVVVVVVVVAAAEEPRRGDFAHYNHDRMCVGLDGSTLDEVLDDLFDVIEQLAFPFAKAIDRHRRLWIVEIDDHDLRLASLLPRLPLLGRARCRGCHSQPSSSSSLSDSVFSFPNGDALRISFMAFRRAFIILPGFSTSQDFPPFAAESR